MMLGLGEKAINQSRDEAVLGSASFRDAGSAEACVGLARSSNTHANEDMALGPTTRSMVDGFERIHRSGSDREP